MSYREKIGCLIIRHERERGLTSHSFMHNQKYRFYYDRLKATADYGLIQGRQLLKMICRAAFNDLGLTDMESVVIIESCLDPELDNILLEVNYNEGWQ